MRDTLIQRDRRNPGRMICGAHLGQGSASDRTESSLPTITIDSIGVVPDVLVRDVPDDDLDLIRAAAVEQGVSLQRYLRNALRAQASYLRRQVALARTAARLRGTAEVPAGERAAVLEAIARAHEQRTDELSRRPAP
jgi:hypothetical protein